MFLLIALATFRNHLVELNHRHVQFHVTAQATRSGAGSARRRLLGSALTVCSVGGEIDETIHK